MSQLISYDAAIKRKRQEIHMSNQMIFKRYEIKFMVPRVRLKKIQMYLASHMIPDIHGQSTIYSLYFDTPDHLLVRRSLDHPVYKERLRLRSYGKCTPECQVFLELKKKYDSVGYKRRVSMTEADAEKYLYFSIPFQGKNYTDRQIFQEIDYARNLYQDLSLCKGIYGKELIDALRLRNGNLEISLTRGEGVLNEL
ncbi:MAG: VTC domain-containing protein [Lachnospiraceae bacterium]